MIQRLVILFTCVFIFSIESYAQSIQWNQPEVVPEKLYRNNRRVLRFSGTASPGTQVRVRENKVKMIFSKTNVRWARIPQKHKVQFPVIASETGYLSFDLYLPTTAVEIPLEIFRNGKWIAYRFAFDVPDTGKADDFEFNEESFRTRRDEDNAKIEDFLSEYDKREDVGQVVNDRGEWKSWVTGKFIVWGSLGLMYSSMSQDLSPGGDLGTMSSASFPTWEIGGEWRWNPQWKGEISYTNRAGSADPDGSYTLQNNDFNWTQFTAQGTYSPKSLEGSSSRWGIKGGVQMHDLPFAKQTSVNGYRIFTNSVTYLTIGGNYETMATKGWNIDANALFMYPVMADNEFDIDSGYGLNANFGMFKEIVPALYLGGKVDFHWLTMETTSNSLTLIGQKVTGDLNLMQLTPSFVLRAEF